MARKNTTRLNLFLLFVFFSLASIVSMAWLVYRFPWPIYLSDFSLAQESTFVSHWPLQALEEDRQERKKLRRFPRTEQQRRLGVIMRRMDYLSVPLFDFFLDSGVQYLEPEMPAGVSLAPSLIWPSFSTQRAVGSEGSAFKDIKYLVMPTSSGVQCLEGISMSAGEELRVNLPVTTSKRNIVFTVLPRVPSHLRAWLGQYSWARQYNDADVNRLQTVSIPVNDPAANILRLSLGSGNLVLTSASVAQWDRTGRLPIQVGQESSIWQNSSKDLGASPDLAQANAEQVADEAANSSEYQQPLVTSNTTTSASDGIQNSQSSNQTAAESAAAPSAGNEVTETKGSKSPNSAKKDSIAKSSSGLDDLLDPISVKFNQVLPVAGSKTIAVGYNILLFQLDPLFASILSDEKLFSILAPNLHSFMSKSLSIPVSLPRFNVGGELFQQTIARQFAEYIPVDIPILTKDILASQSVFNLYQEFRNFGYKVVSFAPPSALALPDVLGRGHEVPKVDGRWLDGNDWRFVSRRRQLDQQNVPATGLEAIFKSDTSNAVASMSDYDFQKVSILLEGIERSSDSIPDWKANELSVISAKSHYLPRLIDGFQRWTKDNSQLRFFGHIYLQNEDQSMRPSFKDFLQVLKLNKLKAFALPGMTERYARIVMLDRVFGTMVDTLIARRIFHRSVISVVLPGSGKEKDLGQFDGRFLLSVPGLSAKQMNLPKIHSLDDLLMTTAQVVGVQLSKYDTQGRLLFRGEGLDLEKSSLGTLNQIKQENAVTRSEKVSDDNKINVAKASEENSASSDEKESDLNSPSGMSKPLQVSRYRMIVLPRAAGCQPFEWNTSSDYYGLSASQPIVEEPQPRGRVIRVYPCGLRDQVIELSWYQNHEGPGAVSVSSSTAANWLGGGLQLGEPGLESESQDSPFFLLGPQALSLDSLPMRLELFSPAEVPQLFDIETRRGIERETLARLLNLNTQIQHPQVSARTLVYFFREPVRR